MSNLKASEIRELLKVAADPSIISFAGGLPAPELFPVEAMKAASGKVMDEKGQKALQYASTEGDPELREYIAKRLQEKNNIPAEADDILMTPGSQTGLDFSGRVFLDKDDIVLLESPSYLGAINAFKANECKFIEVPTDEGGMIMEELEKILAKEDRVKMIYVIPDFQNPTGRTWDLERRHKFMDIVNQYEIPVIEDNPYGDLRFEGEAMPALASLDTKGLVMFLGTFSKILAPGYRLGWVYSKNHEVLEKYNFIAQGAILQAPTVSMLETMQFLKDNDLDEHVAKIVDVYGKRRDVMINCMKENFPAECKFTYSTGGLFTWVVLPEYMNAKELAPQCMAKGVAYVPGGSFFPNGGNENTFRLNYSCMPEDKIIKGIKIIAEVIKENMR